MLFSQPTVGQVKIQIIIIPYALSYVTKKVKLSFVAQVVGTVAVIVFKVAYVADALVASNCNVETPGNLPGSKKTPPPVDALPVKVNPTLLAAALNGAAICNEVPLVVVDPIVNDPKACTIFPILQ